MICHLQAGDPEKVDGVIQSESKGLRTRGACGANPSLMAGKDVIRCPNSSIEAGTKGVNSSLLSLLFVQALNGLDVHPRGWVDFTESIDSNAKLIWKHPHRHTQK